VARGSRRG
jgi:hypothetical protein